MAETTTLTWLPCVDLTLDVPRRLPDAFDSGDRRTAKLHHNTGHENSPHRWVFRRTRRYAFEFGGDMPQRPGTFNCIGWRDMTDARGEIRETIERFIARRFAKDRGIVEQFDPDAVLAGSGASQLHYGREEIVEHFEEAMGKPYTLRHDWERLDIRQNGASAWFFAHGNALIGRNGTETPLPVRVSGVLVRNSGKWLFQLLHVSEPAAE